MYNQDANACNYGIGIGVIAFMACIAFLVVDAIFDNMSSVEHRKYAVIGDLGFSGKSSIPSSAESSPGTAYCFHANVRATTQYLNVRADIGKYVVSWLKHSRASNGPVLDQYHTQILFAE